MEERNSLSVAYGSTAGCRRAAWRIITSVDQKEILEADDAKHSSKNVHQDRILQGTVEQILDVPLLEKAERLVEALKTIHQDRIQQRTMEHVAADTSVPQDVEEPAEFFKGFSQDRVQLRFGGQIIENPAILLAEKNVEVPAIQTDEKLRQDVNMCIQHFVNAVEVEKFGIVEETVQRMKLIIQEKETKQIEVSPLQFTNKVVDISVVALRQTRSFQKTTEISQLQVADGVVDVPAVLVVQVPKVQVLAEKAERAEAHSCCSLCSFHERRSWRKPLRSNSGRSSRKWV